MALESAEWNFYSIRMLAFSERERERERERGVSLVVILVGCQVEV